MPYTLETKDGIVIRNVPDDAPEADLRARVAKVRADRDAGGGTEPQTAPDDLPVLSKLLRHDPQFDYSGVPNARFRAGLSRMDNDAERKKFLERAVGTGGYTQDRFGRLALTVPGLQKLGIKAEKPRVVDEPLPSRYDIADVAGSAPAIGGAMAAATLAAPMAWPAALGMAALGAAGGKGIGEAVEALRGENLQGAGETAADLAKEAALSAAGEGVFRGVVAPIGRKLMAPEAKRFTPEVKALTQEARDIGARPSIAQITKAPLLGRSQAMYQRIFGDPAAEQNRRALAAEIERLGTAARGGRTGAPLDPSEVGEMAVKDIVRGRRALSRWSNIAYGKVDELLGGQAAVPTAQVKQTAQAILEELPKSAKGEAVLADKTLLASLQEVAALPDRMTIGQMQAARSRFHEAIADNSIVPGLSSRYARLLRDSAADALTQLDDPAAADLLKRVNATYGREIKKFDDALVKRITRDTRFAGAIPPEQVVDVVFKRGTPSSIKRVMPLLKKPAQDEVRQLAMQDILKHATRQTEDPLVSVFDGQSLQTALDGYGRETLDAMFGKQLADDLYRFSRVTKFVTQNQMGKGGQLAAQAIALRPLENLGRLVQINLIGKFMNSDKGIQWLTEGLRAPGTRAGAAALSRAAIMINQLAKEEQQAPQ